MIEKRDILKMVRHVVKRGRGIPDKRIMHPVRDWIIGLLITIVLFSGGALYATQLFLENSALNIEQAGESTKTARYNEAVVLDALTQFRERTEVFEKLRADLTNATVIPVADTEAGELSGDDLEEEEGSEEEFSLGSE